MTADKNHSDVFAAQATLYRDAATILSVIFGFILAILAIAFSNSSLVTNKAAIWALAFTAVALGATLVGTSWAMLYYDKKAVGETKKEQLNPTPS